MNAHEHIAAEDLALFALLSLSPEEADAVRAHLGECSLCTAELKQVRQDLAAYALAVEPAALPEGARDRFAARLKGERQEAQPTSAAVAPMNASPAFGAEKERGGSRGRTARVLAWAGWAAAAAAAVMALGLHGDRNALQDALRTEHAETARSQGEADKARRILGTLTDPAAVRVTLTTPKAPTLPTARATYAEKTGTLLLQASNLKPLAPEKVYELWIIPADGGKPIAVGTFSPDAHGNGSLLAPSIPGATAAKAFGITAEPAGGSIGPTLPILLVGAPY